MYNQSKHKERKHFCMYCLQCFSSIEILDAHRKDCIVINGKQAIKMPNKDENEVEFVKVDMKRKFLFSHMKVHEKQE